MKNFLRHLSSYIAPVVVCIVLPWLIVGRLVLTPSPALLVLGLVMCAEGLSGAILSMRMFIRIGKGSIMPWDPTKKLIVASLYRYVRNPMILSILVVLAGEALLFHSTWIALLALFFFAVNTVYFKFSEEPGLVKRFGQEYVEYRKHVPMWVPRLKPWQPG